MNGTELKGWRRKWKLTQGQLAQMLGVIRVTVTRWETETRGIPPFLPLALKALELEIKETGKDGSLG